MKYTLSCFQMISRFLWYILIYALKLIRSLKTEQNELIEWCARLLYKDVFDNVYTRRCITFEH